MFDSGPQFVFNLGGGPGVRVRQFGGARPRARPRAEGEAQAPQGLRSTIANLLPLLVLLIIPILSSLFSDSTTSGPSIHFQPGNPPYTSHRLTSTYKIDYYVNPADVVDFTARKFSQLDQRAEVAYVQDLNIKCETERHVRQRAYDAAQGWFFADKEAEDAAKNMNMPSCQLLDKMQGRRRRGD